MAQRAPTGGYLLKDCGEYMYGTVYVLVSVAQGPPAIHLEIPCSIF